MPNTTVSDSMYTIAVAIVPSTVARGDIAVGIAYLGGGHGSGFHAQVAEQGNGHAAADRGDGAFPADVPRVKLAGGDVEQARPWP